MKSANLKELFQKHKIRVGINSYTQKRLQLIKELSVEDRMKAYHLGYIENEDLKNSLTLNQKLQLFLQENISAKEAREIFSAEEKLHLMKTRLLSASLLKTLLTPDDKYFFLNRESGLLNLREKIEMLNKNYITAAILGQRLSPEEKIEIASQKLLEEKVLKRVLKKEQAEFLWNTPLTSLKDVLCLPEENFALFLDELNAMPPKEIQKLFSPQEVMDVLEKDAPNPLLISLLFDKWLPENTRTSIYRNFGKKDFQENYSRLRYLVFWKTYYQIGKEKAGTSMKTTALRNYTLETYGVTSQRSTQILTNEAAAYKVLTALKDFFSPRFDELINKIFPSLLIKALKYTPENHCFSLKLNASQEGRCQNLKITLEKKITGRFYQDKKVLKIIEGLRITGQRRFEVSYPCSIAVTESSIEITEGYCRQIFNKENLNKSIADFLKADG